MKATIWPNNLGWTIKTRHGEAYGYDIMRNLRVVIPIAPKREWIEHPYKGSPRWSVTERGKVCDVPRETDPGEAVRMCLRGGMTFEMGSYGDDDVPVLRPEPSLI